MPIGRPSPPDVITTDNVANCSIPATIPEIQLGDEKAELQYEALS